MVNFILLEPSSMIPTASYVRKLCSKALASREREFIGRWAFIQPRSHTVTAGLYINSNFFGPNVPLCFIQNRSHTDNFPWDSKGSSSSEPQKFGPLRDQAPKLKEAENLKGHVDTPYTKPVTHFLLRPQRQPWRPHTANGTPLQNAKFKQAPSERFSAYGSALQPGNLVTDSTSPDVTFELKYVFPLAGIRLRLLRFTILLFLNGWFSVKHEISVQVYLSCLLVSKNLTPFARTLLPVPKALLSLFPLTSPNLISSMFPPFSGLPGLLSMPVLRASTTKPSFMATGDN